MQTRRIDALGGRRRTDAEFRLPDGRLVIVEIDGVGHLAVDAWHADLARHNALTVSTGGLILRVTGWEVRNNPDAFFGLLAPLVPRTSDAVSSIRQSRAAGSMTQGSVAGPERR